MEIEADYVLTKIRKEERYWFVDMAVTLDSGELDRGVLVINVSLPVVPPTDAQTVLDLEATQLDRLRQLLPPKAVRAYLSRQEPR